ncbi:MAG: glycosyl transferase family 4 [Candidatus Diapherotrites archaeon]|nr:glycosyl transferase family 4 [Candidatus Diapherotrites archaeon]
MEWLIPIFSFLLSYFSLKLWIDFARKRGLLGRDVHKEGEVLVPEAGGLPLLLSLALSLSLLLFFLPQREELLATIAVFLGIGLIGFVDDVLGWKKGLPQWLKPLLTLFLSVPLAAIAYFNPQYNPFPVPNEVYALLIVPVGVVGASNAVNMLAGLNGLEAGLVLITLFFLSLKSVNSWVFIPALTAMAAVAAFLLFNRYPARVFPGDSFTYAMGALIAALAILSNNEVFATLLFLPYFVELYLKARGGFKRESFGRLSKGKLLPPYPRPYSLTHVFMKIVRGGEREVVAAMLLAYFLWGALLFFLL